jgi:hypothetical protein
MRPLDDKAVLALTKVLKEGTQPCLPYAIEYESSIIVTNQSWLMEWPKELVDMKCSRFVKLFDNRKHKLATHTSQKLLDGHWTTVLFDEAGKYVKVQEEDPDDEGRFIMRHRKELIPYSWVNFEATEMFLPDATYLLYKQPKNQDLAEIMRMLVIYEGDERVGVFANDRMSDG